ncbi:hypothetical protein FOZ63_011905 [Perkinsus olseni]|uniref:SET domain-containing protein n=1 Tax=Perkinsus olseni TaxID=32597 RepID=A0A7J6P7T7_PEROL|nr:hypothetical protein FOZ63_011905 [Perkinsus olseni]
MAGSSYSRRKHSVKRRLIRVAEQAKFALIPEEFDILLASKPRLFIEVAKRWDDSSRRLAPRPERGLIGRAVNKGASVTADDDEAAALSTSDENIEEDPVAVEDQQVRGEVPVQGLPLAGKLDAEERLRRAAVVQRTLDDLRKAQRRSASDPEELAERQVDRALQVSGAAPGLHLDRSLPRLEAHNLSTNFPKCPAHLALVEGRSVTHLIMAECGSVSTGDGEQHWGKWWPCSSKCLAVERSEGHNKVIFEWRGTRTHGSLWASTCRRFGALVNPGERADLAAADRKELRKVMRDEPASSSGSVLPQWGTRTRQTVANLPPSPLDRIHRPFLGALGLRVVRHEVCGRVLVASRVFEQGECIIFSRISKYWVTGSRVPEEFLRRDHPEDSYLLMVSGGSDRLSVYYNSAFDLADPIGSGDLWYLVNHSDRPNTRILGLRDGLAVKAIREISRGEPITWRYPLEYFGEDDTVVSLPRVINVRDVSFS